MSVQVVKGSILDFEGDAIVNAANGFLLHGAGLARVIAKAAAPAGTRGGRDWEQEQRDHPTIAVGNVGVTSAGALPYKGIIHAVGPVWNGGHFHERSLLRSAYVETLRAAHLRGWTQIAVPALSVGLFGYPIPLAAQDTAIALGLCQDLGVNVTLYLFDPNPAKLDILYESFCQVEQVVEGSA